MSLQVENIGEYEEVIDAVTYIVEKQKIIFGDGKVMTGLTKRRKTVTQEEIDERDAGLARWAKDVISTHGFYDCIKEVPLNNTLVIGKI